MSCSTPGTRPSPALAVAVPPAGQLPSLCWAASRPCRGSSVTGQLECRVGHCRTPAEGAHHGVSVTPPLTLGAVLCIEQHHRPLAGSTHVPSCHNPTCLQTWPSISAGRVPLWEASLRRHKPRVCLPSLTGRWARFISPTQLRLALSRRVGRADMPPPHRKAGCVCLTDEGPGMGSYPARPGPQEGS